LWKNCRNILRALLWKIFLQFFQNSFLPPLPVEGPQNLSTILTQFFLVLKNLVHPDWLGEEL
jgi:hypothetical protein